MLARKFVANLFSLVIAAGIALTATAAAAAEKRIKWQMQSAFSSKLPIIGEAGKRFEANVKTISGGSLELKFYEPGALIPPLEGFGAVKAGSVDAMWGATAYHVGTIPSLAWYTGVPFGPRSGEYQAWMKYGGGDEIYDEIYSRHGLKGLHCQSLLGSVQEKP